MTLQCYISTLCLHIHVLTYIAILRHGYSSNNILIPIKKSGGIHIPGQKVIMVYFHCDYWRRFCKS